MSDDDNDDEVDSNDKQEEDGLEVIDDEEIANLNKQPPRRAMKHDFLD